jgi:hypothetical protein
MPNYGITPPQANDLKKVLSFLNCIDKEQQILKIDPGFQHQDINPREQNYCISALQWLDLIRLIASPPGSKYYLLTELGNRLIKADPTTRAHIIREILQEDPVFAEAIQFRRTDPMLLRNILIEKILQPNSNWRSSRGEILSKDTAKRRASCVIAWCRYIGFIRKEKRTRRTPPPTTTTQKTPPRSFLGLPNDNTKQLEKIRTAIEQLSKIHHPREGFTVGEITQFCKETWPGWRYPPTTSTNVGSSVRRTLQHHCSDAKYGGEGTARTALGIKPGDDKDLFRWHKDQELWSIRKSE